MFRLMLDSTPANPTQWAMIVLGIITVVYVVIIRPMRQRKEKDPLSRKPVLNSLAQQRAVERDMGNLLVEYEQMIRRMTASLDTRAVKLEVLMKEADEKIALLKSLSNGQPASASFTPDPAPSEPIVVKPPEPEAVAEDRHGEIYALADKGKSSRDIAKALDRPRGEIDLILALRGGKR